MKQSALTSSRGLAPPKTAFLHQEPENVSMFDTQIYTYRQGVSLVNNLEKRMSEKKLAQITTNGIQWFHILLSWTSEDSLTQSQYKQLFQFE